MRASMFAGDDEGGTVIWLPLVPLTGLLSHWYRANLRTENRR